MITQVARTDALALRAAVLGLLDLKRLLAQEDECDELLYTSNKSGMTLIWNACLGNFSMSVDRAYG
jgi:hypothetical protein